MEREKKKGWGQDRTEKVSIIEREREMRKRMWQIIGVDEIDREGERQMR